MSEYTVKFLFADASTIQENFPLDVSVIGAKRHLAAKWPADKTPAPAAEELKMIFNGKILENTKSFADYKVPAGTLVNMHLQPTPAQKGAASSSAPAPAKAGGEPQR
mmetsp:Transcript_12485/g.34324  ORF Transcript_12485/g.34324 Transcript_12485/m.34324 type:complete len:107 (-) Transcript_12485:1060-1380(-)